MKRIPTKVTKNDLLRLAYGEISGHKKAAVLAAMQEDEELLNYYHEVCLMQQQLDRATKKPSKGLLNRILSAVSREHNTTESDQLQSV